MYFVEQMRMTAQSSARRVSPELGVGTRKISLPIVNDIDSHLQYVLTVYPSPQLHHIPRVHPLAMYVCLCNAVTEREIRHAAQLGATSVSDLKDSLGVGNSCGKCIGCAKQILRDECGSRGMVGGIQLQLQTTR
jgi:bacterioferritin-associated ferredoxin